MTNSNLAYHINIKNGDVGRYVILPGDPGRCESIAGLLDNPRFVSQNREFTIYTGTLLKEKVSVCSTGIGGPSASIAVEELFACGADTFIRVGTCGGIAEKVKSGDIIIANGAVRQEGTSCQYVPLEFPAVADYDVLSALVKSVKNLGFTHHIGIVQCKDSFYGQHSPQRMPVAFELEYKWEAWKRSGVLASEMESSTIFSVASCLGARAGTVLLCVWNQERESKLSDDSQCHDTLNTSKVAVEAIKQLIREDK